MATLTLPQLVAGRGLAEAAVARLGPLEAEQVTVDARPLVSGTASFAAQLVRSILTDKHAAGLTVVGGPSDFITDVRTAAEQLGVLARVGFAGADADLHVAS